MKKELKKKFTKFPTSLYNMRWVEKAATKGYKDFLAIFNDSIPNPDLHIKPDNYRFAMIYYAAFEHALNTFFGQVLDDGITQIELDLKEWDKIIARIKRRDDIVAKVEKQISDEK